MMFVCMYTKEKGMDEPFVEMDIEAVEKYDKLPGIEYNVLWKKKEEHAPWRRTSPANRDVRLKSLAGMAGQANTSGRMDTGTSCDTGERISNLTTQMKKREQGGNPADGMESHSRRNRDIGSIERKRNRKKQRKLAAEISESDGGISSSSSEDGDPAGRKENCVVPMNTSH